MQVGVRGKDAAFKEIPSSALSLNLSLCRRGFTHRGHILVGMENQNLDDVCCQSVSSLIGCVIHCHANFMVMSLTSRG